MKVYDNGGECLGDEWVDLASLQDDTKKAILQMIYLDKTVDVLSGTESEVSKDNAL